MIPEGYWKPETFGISMALRHHQRFKDNEPKKFYGV